MDLGFVGVILGAVIAGVVAIGGEWLRNRHESAFDSAKRENDRRIERDRIQRDNLIEIQTLLATWMIGVTEAYFAEDDSLVRGDDPPVIPRITDGARAAGHRLLYLTDRVKNDALRASLRDFLALVLRDLGDAAVGSNARVIPTLRPNWPGITQSESQVRSKLGEVLRTYL
jgi:hypothetical protein